MDHAPKALLDCANGSFCFFGMLSCAFQPPSDSKIKKHWKMLQNYFDSFEEKIGELKVVAEKVAVKNTIIVMTCNMGQSELLMNFVCNAKAKGLDISNILLFPTDQETKDLAEGLGLATFFDEKVSSFFVYMLCRYIAFQIIDPNSFLLP
jgi:hypothetical protein